MKLIKSYKDIWPDLDYTLFEKAIETWGSEAQFIMAFEECGELIAAIAQSYRNRDVDLVSEVADVFIILSQLSIMLGSDAINDAIERKMTRLQQRLEGAKRE